MSVLDAPGTSDQLMFVRADREQMLSAFGQDLRLWVNERVGKNQRVSAVRLVESLPRSPIGKVLKRELRDGYRGGA